MALIYCPDCGKQVSEHAKTCPKCGCPIRSVIQPFIDRENIEINNKSESSIICETESSSLNDSNNKQRFYDSFITDNAMHSISSNPEKGLLHNNKVRIGLFAGIAALLLTICTICFFYLGKGPEVAFFSPTAHEGERAYVDIKKIYPEIGIIQNDWDAECKWFVCKCRTTIDTEAYVRISCDDYKRFFDPDVNTNVRDRENKPLTSFNPKRIHGIVIKSDSIIDGLSRTVSTYVLDFSNID